MPKRNSKARGVSHFISLSPQGVRQPFRCVRISLSPYHEAGLGLIPHIRLPRDLDELPLRLWHRALRVGWVSHQDLAPESRPVRLHLVWNAARVILDRTGREEREQVLLHLLEELAIGSFAQGIRIE